MSRHFPFRPVQKTRGAKRPRTTDSPVLPEQESRAIQAFWTGATESRDDKYAVSPKSRDVLMLKS